MAYFLSPLFNDAQLDNNGNPLSGGKIYWYLTNTTTPTPTYTDNLGSANQSNPILLNVRGEPTYPIWLASGISYKAVLTDSVDNVIRIINDISGVNDVPLQQSSEWLLYGASASFVDNTHFTVANDQTTIFTASRRVKIPVSAGTCYATIFSSAYDGFTHLTTVTITPDSTVLDGSISTVYYGLTNPLYPSSNPDYIPNLLKKNIQYQEYTKIVGYGVIGTGVYVATATPAITEYTAGLRLRCQFVSAGSTTNTININGLGAIPLKQYSSTGAFVDPVLIAANQYCDLEYISSYNLFLMTDPLPLNTNIFVTKATDETITSVKTFNNGYEPKAANMCKAWACIDCIVSGSLSYTVTSGVCTVTEAAHIKKIGSIVQLNPSTGVLTAGNYVVTTIAAGSYTVAAAVADGSGTLTIPMWIKEHFNIAAINKNGTGDFTLDFAAPFTSPFYTMSGTVASNGGVVTFAGTGVGGATLKTITQCNFSTADSTTATKSNYKEVSIQFFGR